MKLTIPFFAACAAAVLAIGCGGSDTQIIGKSPRVKALNAITTTDQPLTVKFSEGITETVGYGMTTDYKIVDNVNQSIKFQTAAGADLASSTEVFRNNTFYTVIGIGGADEGRDAKVFEDREVRPSNNTYTFRIVNATKGFKQADVWVANGDVADPRTTGEQVADNLDPLQATRYFDGRTANQVTIAATSEGGDVVYGRTVLNLENNHHYKIVIIRNDDGAKRVDFMVYKEGENETGNDVE